MKKKKYVLMALISGTALTATGCADDNMAKGLVTIAGLGAGAMIGRNLSDPGMKTQGMFLGGMVGLAAGYGVGSAITGGGGLFGSSDKK